MPRGGDGVLERTLHGDLAATWQQCASALGSPLVALAEVVTSMPGGAAQAWHQDGAGLTMQIALCKCGLAQGPTEVRPRPFRAEKLLALTRDRDEYSAFEPIARALHKLERPIYDGTGRLHAAFWEAVGPRLSREQAALGMSAGVLPPPPSVRLTAEPGDLVLYDGAMQHRGGANSRRVRAADLGGAPARQRRLRRDATAARVYVSKNVHAMHTRAPKIASATPVT